MTDKKKQSDTDAPKAPEAPKAPKPPEPPKPVEKSGDRYVVAKGRAVCCGGFAGILKEGKEVTLAHLGGSETQAKQSLEALIKSGTVVKG
jgi:hypothetical protein